MSRKEKHNATRSMTAFARREGRTNGGSLVWELRSVNHRYLEVMPRLPEGFRELEGEVRERCRQRLGRGKVDVGLRFQPDPSAIAAEPDMEVVRQLANALEKVSSELPQVAPADPVALLALPGVLATPEADSRKLHQDALALLDEALGELVSTREREGAAMAEVIRERLAAVTRETGEVRKLLPDILANRRERLRERVEEALGEPDRERLEQELVLMAQKMDVAEELDRLDAHVTEVHRVLGAGGAVGRRLDFLMQELHREANTLSSKSVEAATTRAAVELKVLIEQMREQIQNIE